MSHDGRYLRVINEYGLSSLWKTNKDTFELHTAQTHCCGESPYASHRTFTFGNSKARLIDNYVQVNPEYTGLYRTLPDTYLQQPTSATVTRNYNVRFSPTLQPLKGATKKVWRYGCKNGTDIIANIHKGSTVKVLAELTKPDRTWLFVSVPPSAFRDTCKPPMYDHFENQNLRGWISATYVSMR